MRGVWFAGQEGRVVNDPGPTPFVGSVSDWLWALRRARAIAKVERQQRREVEREARETRKAMKRFEEMSPVCAEVGHVEGEHSFFSGGGAWTCQRCGVTYFWQLGSGHFHVQGERVDG